MNPARLVDRLRSSLWFVPTLAVVAATALLFLLLQVDGRITVHGLLRFGGSPLEAREVASTIAGAMLGFIGIVFSITVIAVQLASSQYSPRVLRTFLRSPLTQAALGAFVGTFWYGLMLVKFLDASLEEVPDLTVDALFVLAFVAVLTFIAYVHDIVQSMRIVSILDAVATETRGAIDAALPTPHDRVDHEPGEHVGPSHDVRASEAGVVATVDVPALVHHAAAAGCTIEVLPAIGDFVRCGGLLARIHGGVVDQERILAAITQRSERTMQQDVEFGFRQIVDVAERALSPGVNDSTTAVQSIDRLHDLLGRVGMRPDPPTWHRDDEGTPRLELPTRSWDDYVALSVDAVRRNAGASVSVHARLRGMVVELAGSLPAERRPALEERLAELDSIADDTFARVRDRREARSPDDRG